jgi:FixJ family two-component response regulator
MEIYEGKHPIPKIVFYGDEDHVSCAVKAYETGAMDYMIRPLGEEKIEQLFHLSQKENLL